MMKNYISFLFLFAFLCFQAQEITDKEAFKKCRKEFNKKTCLLDEDGDEILNYLDQCKDIPGVLEMFGCPFPDTDGDGVVDDDDACENVAGPTENKGCPWEDTDSDGILDKDDKCPSLPGVIEKNGCPKGDCSEFVKKQKEKFQKFQKDELANTKKYENLKNKVFNDLVKNKEILGENVYLSVMPITFVNDYYPTGYESNCYYFSDVFIEKRQFIDSLMMNRKTFLIAKKFLNKNIFPVLSENNRLITKSMLLNNSLFGVVKENYYFDFVKGFDKIYEEVKQDQIYYLLVNKKALANYRNSWTSIQIIPYWGEEDFIFNRLTVVIQSYTTINVEKMTRSQRVYQLIENNWKLIEKISQ